ncbi:homoserine kinase [Thermococcus atlanticus]
MKVLTQATVANFGPGFDVFGLCLNEPFDVIRIRESSSLTLRVHGFRLKIPEDPLRNVASIAALRLARMAGAEVKFEMSIHKGIRPKSGLGSSGASALGGALAMAKLLGIEDRQRIIKAALEGEKAASGSAHGDNVVPSLFGGFTITKSLSPLEVFRLDVDFRLVVVLPEIEISTKRARKVLPEYVPLKDAVRNVALASALISALKDGDIETAGRLLDDHLAIPYRKSLMPWFDRVRNAALESGAYGVSISGSGPAMFALGEGLEGIGKAMKEAFEDAGIRADYRVVKVGGGAKCSDV